MKKQYIITTKDHNMLGIIPTREMLDLFMKDRKKEDYFINGTKDENIINGMHRNAYCAMSIHGHVLFVDEFEYYVETFHQFLADVDFILRGFLTDSLPYLKLEKDQMEIVIQFMEDIFLHMKNFEDRKNETFDDIELDKNESDHFTMDEFILPAIALYDN